MPKSKKGLMWPDFAGLEMRGSYGIPLIEKSGIIDDHSKMDGYDCREGETREPALDIHPHGLRREVLLTVSPIFFGTVALARVIE